MLLLFALLFDAGELSWLSRSVNYVRFLQKEGFFCNTKIDEFVEGNHTYHYRDCTCMKDQKIRTFVEHVFVFLFILYIRSFLQR